MPRSRIMTIPTRSSPRQPVLVAAIRQLRRIRRAQPRLRFSSDTSGSCYPGQAALASNALFLIHAICRAPQRNGGSRVRLRAPLPPPAALAWHASMPRFAFSSSLAPPLFRFLDNVDDVQRSPASLNRRSFLLSPNDRRISASRRVPFPPPPPPRLPRAARFCAKLRI